MERLNIYDIKHIERYLQGEMEEDELKHFENELKKSATLKDKVDKVKSLPSNLYLLEKDRLSNQVKDWMRTDKKSSQLLPGNEKSKRFRQLRIVGIAASIIALVFVTGYWLLPYSNQNLNSITQNHITQYHKSPIVLRASSDERWESAIQSYRNGNFNQMIVQMRPIMEGREITVEQQFYFALAHLYSQPAQPNEALFYFNQIKQQDDSMYSEEISWYQALIYIQREEFDKARLELIKIKNSNQFGSDAEDLLKVLN